MATIIKRESKAALLSLTPDDIKALQAARAIRFTKPVPMGRIVLMHTQAWDMKLSCSADFDFESVDSIVCCCPALVAAAYERAGRPEVAAKIVGRWSGKTRTILNGQQLAAYEEA